MTRVSFNSEQARAKHEKTDPLTALDDSRDKLGHWGLIDLYASPQKPTRAQAAQAHKARSYSF